MTINIDPMDPMDLPKDMIILICEDLAIWRKLRMTSKTMAGLLGRHYEHYPNQMRFLIKIDPNSDDTPMIIGKNVYDTLLSLDDILYMLEQYRTNAMISSVQRLILTNDISKTNGEYTINSYVNMRVYSRHEQLGTGYLQLRFDNIAFDVVSRAQRELHMINGILQLVKHNHSIITVMSSYEPYYTALVEKNHDPLAWRLYTILSDKYAK